MSARKILFLDRDGTLLAEPADFQIDALAKFRLEPELVPALRALRDAGWRFVMVSNQDGLGSASFPEADFRPLQDLLLSILDSQGIGFDEVLICPHRPEDGCECRKPRLGLLRDYLRDPSWDRERSAVIGDRDSDLRLAENLGIAGLRYARDGLGWAAIARALTTAPRRAALERRTRETAVRVALDLDAPAPAQVQTGLGFFDHMLEQIAKHAGIGLKLECTGDLHIDEHHTVEDTGLALGAALKQAVGDKWGIARYGFVLPMDEALAEVVLERLALDCSGRGYFVFEGEFGRERVGELPTELVPHFFRSFAEAAGLSLHMSVRGDNAHHMIEALFKGLGRALRQALRRESAELPSTKGAL